MLDQRALPANECVIEARDVATVADAIRSLAVRGAPLLGVVAAYGVALAAYRSTAVKPRAFLRDIGAAGRTLIASRPTAVNVAWAVGRVLRAADTASAGGPPVEAIRRAVLEEAAAIEREDRDSCDAIGRFGAALVPERANVLTHCNTGRLATAGAGTAQSVISTAFEEGRHVHVWVDETRPVLQGARLTAWELTRLGIPMTLVADTAAGSLMARGLVDLVVVGADRIAANGDVANKVGTYQLAVLARHHHVPFYVAAPVSTIDLGTPTGDGIVVEERAAAEVTEPLGLRIAPEHVTAANPAFDVTPARLVTAIVTDRGVASAPYRRTLRRLLGRDAAWVGST